MTTQSLLLEESSRLKAIGMMCAAIGLFALLNSTAKYLVGAAAMPLFQVVWMRFTSHAVLNAVIFGPHNAARALKSTKPWMQFVRGLFLFGSTAFNIAALRYLQLDQSVTIFFLTPFLVTVLAGPLLGEWIGWRRFLAVLVGFSGVILVVRPGFGGIHWAASYSFLATTCYASTRICTRYLAQFDRSLTTQIYSPLPGMVAMAPLAFSVWVWPELGDLAAVDLARACGRDRPLHADPGAQTRAGAGARAVHLCQHHFPGDARLCRVPRHAERLDAGGRGGHRRVRSLHPPPRAGGRESRWPGRRQRGERHEGLARKTTGAATAQPSPCRAEAAPSRGPSRAPFRSCACRAASCRARAPARPSPGLAR